MRCVLKCNALVRKSPSINSDVVRKVKKGSEITVKSGTEKKVTEKKNNKTYTFIWVKTGKYWIKKKAIRRKKKNYRLAVAKSAEEVYKAAVRSSCAHSSGVTTLSGIKKRHIINCSGAVSAVLHRAGCLPSGEVGHRSAVKTNIVSRKNTIKKSMIGYKKTKHIKWVYCGKKYADIPDKYKKAGIIYVQDSNICISAGNGQIWSCNLTGKRYTSMSSVKHGSGYCFNSPILVIGLPRTE